jgi:hypothetical protein
VADQGGVGIRSKKKKNLKSYLTRTGWKKFLPTRIYKKKKKTPKSNRSGGGGWLGGLGGFLPTSNVRVGRHTLLSFSVDIH